MGDSGGRTTMTHLSRFYGLTQDEYDSMRLLKAAAYLIRKGAK